MDYPFSSNFIINDSVFTAYGGLTGSSTAMQRSAAYWMAERQMTSHLGAFLKLTIITGTHYLDANNDPLKLDYGYLHSIQSFKVRSMAGYEYVFSSTDLSNYLQIRNARDGLVDVYLTPYQWSFAPLMVDVAYNSGIPTGTSCMPDVLWSLTMASQIFLNEIDPFLSNESVADIGVQEFSNQFYHEIRTKLGHNEFGSSAVAQKISAMVKHLRSHSALKFH